MRLYRGQITLAFAIYFALKGGFLMWMYYVPLAHEVSNGWVFLLFMAGCLSFIAALTLAALAYASWAPKWERIEKRTGRIPGDEGKK